ncbi:MAG: hypothetical protein WBV45_09180 [Lutimonas sp.]
MIKNSMKRIGQFVFVALSLLALTSFISNKSQQEDGLIVGTWIPEGSPNHRMVFSKSGVLTEYNENNVVYSSSNFKIATTSPQCGFEVEVGPLFSYLILENENEIICYEILTLNAEYLALRTFGHGGQNRYYRQK